MPRNRVFDDLDHVPIESGATKLPKEAPPVPWPVPEFEPLEINNPLTFGRGKLPNSVFADDHYGVFCLFFDEYTIGILVENTKD